MSRQSGEWLSSATLTSEQCQTGRSLGPGAAGVGSFYACSLAAVLPDLPDSHGHFLLLKAPARNEIWGWPLPRL